MFELRPIVLDDEMGNGKTDAGTKNRAGTFLKRQFERMSRLACPQEIPGLDRQPRSQVMLGENVHV